jgi:hypothetical protein
MSTDAVGILERDLRAIFGERLQSLVVYRAPIGEDRTPTLALVESVSADELGACAARIASWDDAGLATPLIIAAPEFARSLDVFPFEFGAILADHTLVCGVDPFEGLRVDPGHLRQACEVQVRSHLLHLREGFLETQGRGDQLAGLLLRSAAPLAGLLASVARLLGHDGRNVPAAAALVEKQVGLPDGSLGAIAGLAPRGQLSSDAARRLFPPYLAAIERLTTHVDRWSGR